MCGIRNRRRPALAGYLAALLLLAATPALAEETIWRFDNLSRIGGMTPRVEGKPALIDVPGGPEGNKAVAFNGRDDALLLPARPLVGAKAFTIEAIFRPDGGAFEQRWMHIAETNPATGADTEARDRVAGGADANPRFMFEIRVTPGGWYLDAYIHSKGGNRALIVPEKLHPIGRWYAVAQSYDGRIYRAYVNGVLQAEAEVPFVPHGPGRAMIGARMNHVNYFQGAVAQIRFNDRALAPEEFLKAPGN